MLISFLEFPFQVWSIVWFLCLQEPPCHSSVLQGKCLFPRSKIGGRCVSITVLSRLFPKFFSMSQIETQVIFLS